MKLWTPDGSKQINADKDQYKALVANGFSKEKPVVEAKEPEQTAPPEEVVEAPVEVEKTEAKKAYVKPIKKKIAKKIAR